ncbi:MAG: hypothetical protein IT320_03375 [Anaerolineae bacterium]|nr:hypothetical protein [Anaerolineae bacterium]
MTFNYAEFRAEFIRLKQAQREREIAEDKRRASREVVERPTEFAASLRLRAAQQRLSLTELEKRVLYHDKRYLRREPNARSDYVTEQRAQYIATQARCQASSVPRLLANIEWVHWRCALLGIAPDDVYRVHVCRIRRRDRGRWRVHEFE